MAPTSNKEKALTIGWSKERVAEAWALLHELGRATVSVQPPPAGPEADAIASFEAWQTA